MYKTEMVFRYGNREEIFYPDPQQILEIFDILERKSAPPFIKKVELSVLEKCICDYYNIKTFKTKTRKRNIVIPRHVFSYLAYLYGPKNLCKIGAFLDGRDHSTISHSHKTVMGWLKVKDEKILTAVSAIKRQLFYNN